MIWALVAVGAAVGAVVRFLVGGWLDSRPGPGGARLPWGTLAVNVSGSLLLGWSSALALDGGLAALLAVGFCGSLTTYSSFAVQTVALGLRSGTAYAALTLGLSLAACAVGHAAGS